MQLEVSEIVPRSRTFYSSLAGMNPEKFLQCWTEGNMIQQPKSLTG